MDAALQPGLAPSREAVAPRVVIILTLALALGLMPFARNGQAQSRTLRVINLADAGFGSLRDAVAEAAPGDTIDFAVAGTIPLESRLIIDIDLNIDGGGAIVLSGQDQTGILEHRAGALTLRGLELLNGQSTQGGAIWHQGGVLTLEDCRLVGNRAGQGGAIMSDATAARPSEPPPAIHLTRCALRHNRAAGSGGGISVLFSPLTIRDSQLRDNQAGTIGGGLEARGPLVLSRSILTANRATDTGSAAYLGGDAAMDNCLIAENVMELGSGGETSTAVYSFGRLRLSHCTLFGNQVLGSARGTGLFQWSSYAEPLRSLQTVIRSSLIIGNTPRNCGGGISDGGGNIQYPGDSCGDLLPQAKVEFTEDRDATERLQTLYPAADSAAIDAAPDGPCHTSPVLAMDILGRARPRPGRPGATAACDIGAFELGSAATPTPGYRPRATPTGEPPDLVTYISGHGYSNPGNCADFGPYRFSVAVVNLGPGAAGATELEVGGDRFGVPAMPVGGYWGRTMDSSAFSSPLLIDPENVVVEVLEDNNRDRAGPGPFLDALAEVAPWAGGGQKPSPAERPSGLEAIGPKPIPQRTEPVRCTHTPTPPGGPTRTPTKTPTPEPIAWGWPDAWFDEARWTRECTTGRRQIQPCLATRGPGAGRPYRVVSEPPGLSWDIDPAVSACGEPLVAPPGLTALRIDPQNEVRERSEANNRRGVAGPDFPPPLLCSPTPSLTPTPSRTPTVTLTPSISVTPSITPTPTLTPTRRVTPSRTATKTATRRPERLILPRLDQAP